MTAQRNANRLAVTSSLAIATALLFGGAQAARAQSFDASGTVVAGSASISTGTNTTSIVVGGSAVIDWTPNDTSAGTTPINFQPAGTTATFSSTADFTVLNRILPATNRAVQFNGTVLAQFGLSAPTTGGTVYFYSPNGIVAGSTALFDVGNLGLTTLPVAFDAATGAFDTTDTVSFGLAPQNSNVTVGAGARINSTGYVAIVAPAVAQFGTINLNGGTGSGAAAALVAARAADITFSPDGLFDITVNTGTIANGQVLENGGSIIGTGVGSAGANHRIYMVAVPQNQAITMAITSGSQLGFDIAGAADVVGNAVVLSGGYNVVNGEVATRAGGTGATAVSMSIGGIDVSSALRADATGAIDITASTGAINLASEVILTSSVSTAVTATSANGFVTVGGDLTLDSTNVGAVGGIASLNADSGGHINVGGTSLVYASGFGTDAVVSGTNGGTGIGGTASMSATNSGQININGLALVFADGIGGNATVAGSGGGNGQAGTVNLTVTNGGAINLSSSLDFTAEGFGANGNGCTVCAFDGGRATGGTANLFIDNGTITTSSYFRNSVRAIGGTGTGAKAGDSTGGTFNGTLNDATISSGAQFLVDANGIAGNHLNGGTGGVGGGGIITINSLRGALSAPQLSYTAFGQGGASTVTGGIGGRGVGGTMSVTLGNANVGNIDLNAGGFGADGDQQGGDGSGGRASLSVRNVVTAGGPVTAFAHGSGGNALGSATNTVGGGGSGGIAEISANIGTLNATRGAIADASAFGGSGANGGAGFGGDATLFAINDGALNITDTLGLVQVHADGSAGSATAPGGKDGDTSGGNAAVSANGSALTINAAALEISARGIRNADSGVAGTDGGRSFGGNAVLRQDTGATITINGDVLMNASAEGGHNFGGGDLIGGSAQAGTAILSSNGSGSLTVNGRASLIAVGEGGNGNAASGVSNGGDGSGGSAEIRAQDGSVSITSAAVLTGTGYGGTASVDGAGGRGFGGFVGASTSVGAGPGTISFGDNSNPNVFDASGLGGNGSGTGAGGAATGGTAQIIAVGGNIGALGTLVVSADAAGGGSVDGLAGAATGGTARLTANGYALAITSDFRASAAADGGNASGLGNGGVATGGSATAFANNAGSIQLQGAAEFDAFAFGGDSSSVAGNGGNATGGQASLSLRGGAGITVSGDLSVDAGARGGDGDLNNGTGLGGNATGGNAFVAVGADPVNDGGGGTISLGSFVQVNAKGIGGDAGQAGNGTGGGARVLAWNGTLTTNATSNLVINANGDGGFGNAGGDGGNGTGGTVNLFAGNSLNGGSTISVDNVTATAVGNGGFGNRGLNPGDTGGNGGNGTGGMVIVTAGAGNGNLTAGFVNAQAGGFGGGAGDGGSDANGTGGIGGIGGIGSGGAINVGTESATSTPNAVGSASYGTIQMSSQGVGGAGGAGGTGVTQGNGGDGGDAFSGASVLLVRGSTVNVSGTTTMFAGATGGNGGAGPVNGVGGDATVGGNGGVAVTVTSRFQVPTQRGTLNAGDISGNAPVLAGSGSIRGVATVADSPLNINITNADATVGQLQLFALPVNPIVNGQPVVTGAPSSFAVTNGTLTANGRVDFATAGDLTFAVDNGVINVPRIDVSGRNWIAGPTPVSVGTLNSASTIDFQSAGDLVANVNISAASDLFFSAAGDVLFADIDAGGNLLIQNGGTTTLGNLSVIGNVDLLSAGSIATLGVDAGGYLNYESTGSVTTGALAAGQYIEIDSLGGPASVGNVDAGDYFTLQANGPVTVGNITAGIVTPSTDPLATYRVGVAGVGNVTVGTVNAAGDVGLLAQTGSVTSGALTGRDMLLFADTGVTVGGALNANGRVGVAKSAVAALGGNFDTFDKEPVFAALPFQVDGTSAASFGVGGPVAINGPVQVQSFRAYTTSDLTTAGPITATNGPLSLAAGGNIGVAGNLTGPFVVAIANGTLNVGNVTAPSLVGLFGLSGTTTGAISSGGAVLITSNGDVSTGNVASDPALFGLPANSNSKVQIFGRNLATGSVTSSQGISLVANQGMVTGPLQSQTDTLLLAGTGVTVNGAVNAQRLGIANASQASLGGPVATFDPSLVFAGLPSTVTLPVPSSLAVAGPVTISGPVQSTSFKSFSNGAFSVGGNLTSGSGGILVGANGDLSVAGNLSSNAAAVLVSQGTATVGNVTSPFAVAVVGAQGVNAGNLSSTGNVQVFSNGNISAGNLVSSPGPTSPSGNVIVAAGGSASVANVSSGRNASIAAGQNINVGQVNARLDLLLLPGQSLTAGSLRAGVTASDPVTGVPTAATGRILIGNNSMYQAGGSPANPDFNAIFAATPVAAGGQVDIGGSVYAGFFDAYNTGNFSANDITAFTRMHIESGGTATVRRRWFSPILDLWSGDIVIQAAPVTNPTLAVGLNAGTTGEITLYATNANGAFIGDGLTAGNGYALSQAEFSLINSGTVFVTAKDQSANLIDMTVGNLTMTGPQSGSTIDDPNGQVVFATGTMTGGPNSTGTPSGGLRISGNLSGTGFLSTNEVAFLADLFELDAGTGSVKITNASGALSGLISIEATHIHMAESGILTKLEADPFYAGHITDLNTPTTVSRPDGIFNALALDIFPGSTFYIQNTGTVATPAGFLAGPDVDVTPPNTPPTGGIEVVVSGQFVTDTGTLTGKAAYDALIAAGPDFTGFSVNGQLNACLFIGGCAVAEDPVGGISSEIEMISDSDLSDSPVVEDEPDEANSEEQSEEEKAAEEDVDGSPIAPPAPLIDTRPLNPPATITEPVAGSGNPALIGSVVNEGTAQEDQQ